MRAAANELRHNERGDNQQHHHAQRLHINRHNNQPRCLATYHELRDAVVDRVHLLGALQHAEEALRHERQPNHFAEPRMHHVWPERHFFSILFKPVVFFFWKIKNKHQKHRNTALLVFCVETQCRKTKLYCNQHVTKEMMRRTRFKLSFLLI